MEYAIRIGFKATNNEAEYEALLTGLRVVEKLGVESLDAYSDSMSRPDQTKTRPRKQITQMQKSQTK